MLWLSGLGQLDYAAETLPVFVLNRGPLLNERICSSKSKFYLLRVDSMFKSFFIYESKLEVTKIVSLCQMAEKHGDVAGHLKLCDQGKLCCANNSINM